jgi:tRNA pseudouridine38-40 synthase
VSFFFQGRFIHNESLFTDLVFRFHIFFHHIDHYRTNAFLWVTSTGIPAARQALGKAEVCSEAVTLLGSDSEDEADGNGGNEEG